MNNDAIRIGDLVAMVRGHRCAYDLVGGVPFVVTGFIAPLAGGWTCGACGERNAAPNERAAYGVRSVTKKGKNHAAIPISWLKKFNQPAALESPEKPESGVDW